MVSIEIFLFDSKSNIFNILPIFDRHKIGKFQTKKSLLGIKLWAIIFLPIKWARCLPQTNAIKFLGNHAEKIFWTRNKSDPLRETTPFCHDIRRRLNQKSCTLKNLNKAPVHMNLSIACSTVEEKSVSVIRCRNVGRCVQMNKVLDLIQSWEGYLEAKFKTGE